MERGVGVSAKEDAWIALTCRQRSEHERAGEFAETERKLRKKGNA